MTRASPRRAQAGHLEELIGSRVRLNGWVQDTRPSANPPQLTLRDHTGVVLVMCSPRELPSASSMEGLTTESAIEVEGDVERDEDGSIRLVVARLDVVGPAAAPLPLRPGAALAERLDWRFLDLRDPRRRLVFEVETTAERAMRELWEEQDFIEIHSPKLRPLPNKSGGELFAVEYFGRRVYLAQSPQWYKQMAMAAGFGRVFEIGPVFRPQSQATARHDTEFTSVDVEVSWISSLDDVIAQAEQLVSRVTVAVRERHGDALDTLLGVSIDAPSVPFPRVTFADACRVVRKAGHDWADEEDLDPEGERLLAAHVAREHGHELVFVVDYPERSRPYYHMLCADGSRDSRSFDLLFRGLEVASGAQREHRYERLFSQARARGVDVNKVQTYLDFFKYGCPPHGGFGLGLSRLLMSLLRITDVREATYVFRGPDRITP